MRPPKHFYIYIMTNGPRSHVLYTGVTGNLSRRVFEHKHKLVPGFTSRYNLTRLAYYEMFYDAGLAIMREKEIKGWGRGKKLALIESKNPHWYALAAAWEDVYKPVDRLRAQVKSTDAPRKIPQPAELRRFSG